LMPQRKRVSKSVERARSAAYGRLTFALRQHDERRRLLAADPH